MEVSSPLRSLGSCKERDGERGSSRCGDLASEGVEIYKLATHRTGFYTEPHVSILAEKLGNSYAGRKRKDNQGVDVIPLLQPDDVAGFARWV